jgi:hypothetical protein
MKFCTAFLGFVLAVLATLTGCEFQPYATVADGGDASADGSGACSSDPQCGDTRICYQGACISGCRIEGSMCGSTGLVCRSGQCVNPSVCTPACTTGNHCVGGSCIPGCDNDSQCPGGYRCSNSQCVVSNPCGSLASCNGGACVNLATDVTNCGACNHACASGQTCASGVCTGGQDGGGCTGSGFTYCGASCVNTQTNFDNCGSCGHACASGQTCSSGSCVTPDGGVTPFRTPDRLYVQLSAAMQAGCPGGYVIIAWGPWVNGSVVRVESSPGAALDTSLVTSGTRWSGYVNVGARCGDSYVDWSPTMRTGRAAGASLVRLTYTDSTTSDLTDVSLTCGGGGPGVKLQIPIDGATGCRI